MDLGPLHPANRFFRAPEKITDLQAVLLPPHSKMVLQHHLWLLSDQGCPHRISASVFSRADMPWIDLECCPLGSTTIDHVKVQRRCVSQDWPWLLVVGIGGTSGLFTVAGTSIRLKVSEGQGGICLLVVSLTITQSILD